MKRVFIFQDTEKTARTADLLDAAGKMFSGEPLESWALVAGTGFEEIVGAFDHIVHVPGNAGDPLDLTALCRLMAQLHEEHGFDAVLVPATPFGRMAAPRLAKRLGTGIVADVTDIRRNDGRLELVRPAFSGRIMAGIEVLGKGPVMLSVRPGVFRYAGARGLRTEVIERRVPPENRSRMKRLGVTEKTVSYDIRESEILVSGGGGVLRGFSGLDRLAEALNGRVSASRKIVDKGIAPRSIQVGQSGKTVSPRLYMALGINGAIQHVEGLKNIESIISINTNRNAPICSLSDIVVEGDAMEFIDKLTERIRAYRNEQKGEQG